ncbi:serine hydrolase domain-containing protein [Nocardioides iriomotensis]|uniref:Class A beta-lactamase-related serine hydrolase n=1 Tax=Nocardioides iriomotensis TaxID=715784 RepID=A0A4Q5J044_9ACTN|nr:serine hydrolase domain-containing protein [Nocardioides iriomotensis]RYU10749.1 class A beta-lactamase-related serine hydrolase [Nocardioides iriomotensis]
MNVDWSAWSQELQDRITADPRTAHTADLVVVQSGQLVHDARLLPGELRDCFSVTKTVLGVLTGIAIDEGRLTLDDPVDGDGPDAATVRHVLTMTRGVAAAPEDIDDVMSMLHGWGDALRDVKRTWAPGTRFRYDNGAAHLLAIRLTEAFGDDLLRVARRHLFDLLGIGEVRWRCDPEGYRVGTGHLEIAATDLARLGRLVHEGGHGLVDPTWVTDMTTAWTKGGAPEGCGYGYLTWVTRDGWFMGGWAGQHVSAFPDLDLIVVTTGDPARLHPEWKPARGHVVAGVRDLTG